MKSKINPETGELVWEGETKAEKKKAAKANKAAKAKPLEALAKAFGENETFEAAESDLIEAIRVIPEAKIKRFKKTFAAYQNEGGEFEDLKATLVAAFETLIFG